MMLRPSDEQLVAFLDGEIDDAQCTEIEAWLARDADARDRLALLTETSLLVREAFDAVLQEPVPQRLIEAAQGRPDATILNFRPKIAQLAPRMPIRNRRWWLGMAAAASVFGIMLGGTGGYYIAGGGDAALNESAPVQTASTSGWLDNVAGYHNLLISSATGAEHPVFDVPAGAESHLPVDIRIPDLKPWGLAFQGARRLVMEGKPAFQFFYATDNKELGPITLTVTTSTQPDLPPTFGRRENVNLLYWRHAGHGYAIVGSADKGYMWGLANDIAWQLKAI